MVQIFIAHSSKDKELISTVIRCLREIGVEPYVAELEDPTPYPLPEKIDKAIDSSVAMFVFLTRNVAETKSTRDVVNWEIASAYAKRKPVYVFVEKGVEVPLMVNYITVYATYDPSSREDLEKMKSRMQEIARMVKESSDLTKAASTAIMLLLGILFFKALSSRD